MSGAQNEDVGTPSSRHAPLVVLETYDRDGVGGVLVVEGEPPGRLRIWPQHRQLSLLVQVVDNIAGPELLTRSNLAYGLYEDGGVMWHRLDVTYASNLDEVYPVLCTILDRVQIGGETFRDAVERVVAGLEDLLAGRGGLSHEKQLGLFGELVALVSLAVYASPEEAVSAWRGPDGEEHDFGLPYTDLEVKTTMSEERNHWIGSLTQLQPTPGRELNLLSIQLTAAGSGPGATLTELVDVARQLDGIPLSALDRGLESAGWRSQHGELYRSRWVLRTPPAFYVVDYAFPALTTARIAATVSDSHRITDVRYRVNLENLTPSIALFPVALAEVNIP